MNFIRCKYAQGTSILYSSIKNYSKRDIQNLYLSRCHALCIYVCHLFNHSPRQPRYGHCGHSLYCPCSPPHSSPVSPPTPWDCICNVQKVEKLNFITSHIRQVNITVKTFWQLWYSKQQLYTATHSHRTQASLSAIRLRWLDYINTFAVCL